MIKPPAKSAKSVSKSSKRRQNEKSRFQNQRSDFKMEKPPSKCVNRLQNAQSASKIDKAPEKSQNRRQNPRSGAKKSVIYLNTDIFFFGKKLQSLETAFAPDAGIFHSAERRSQIAQKPAVDPDDARFESFRRRDARAKDFPSRRLPTSRIRPSWRNFKTSSSVSKGVIGDDRDRRFLPDSCGNRARDFR